jgi:autotransporter passenger strand-loop-strand repeat protein
VVDIPGFQISDAQIVTGEAGTPYVLSLSAGVVIDGLTVSAGSVVNGPGELLGANAIYGRENGVTVGSGGSETVYADGLAGGAMVLSGGREVVSAAGSSVSAQVSRGGVLQVASGGTASSAAVLGGIETILTHGAASATVLSGGYEYDYGTASGTVISSGGHEDVAYGAAASGSEVSSGGQEVVSSGGRAAGAIVSGGGLYVSSGGQIAGGLTIEGGVADISGTVGPGQTVSFTGASGVLGLYDLAAFHARISGMSGLGQKIELGGFAYASGETASWAQSGSSGTLTVSDGGKTAQLTLVGDYVSSDFHLATDGKGGSYLYDPSALPSAQGPTQFVEAMAGFSGRTPGYDAIHAGEPAPMSAAHPVTAGSSGR